MVGMCLSFRAPYGVKNLERGRHVPTSPPLVSHFFNTIKLKDAGMYLTPSSECL
jgi:hypothetical protein